MDFKTFLFMVLSPMTATLMIILNLIEIWFIFKHKIMDRVKSTVYILNLAVSDIILGIFVLMVKILKLAEKNHGINPRYRLFFQLKMIYISLYVSVLTLAALTVERVLAVKKPMFYNMLEWSKKCMICVAIWVVTILALFLHSIAVDDHEKEYIKTPLVIFVTAFLITVSYAVILRTLKRRTLRNAQQNETAGGQNEAKKKTFNKAEKRFLSFCIKSFIIFVVCWMPLAAYGVALSSGLITTWKYKDLFDFVTHIIAFWNSNVSAIMFLHHNRGVMRRINVGSNSASTSNETRTSKVR